MPFSYRGSWLNLSPVIGLQTSAEQIHLVSHVNKLHPIFELTPERHGKAVRTEWHADPASLEWRAQGATVTAVFEGPDRLRIRGRGLQLRLTEPSGALTPFTGGYLFMDPVDGAAVLTSYETGRRYRIRMIVGSLDCTGVEALGRARRSILLGGPGEEWDAELIEATTGAEQPGSGRAFEAVVQDADGAFAAYLGAVAPWRDSRTPSAALAAYALWSATVAPQGRMTRESVLMSKHWMDKVWSWDHCFNALALAGGLPDLALDQFFLPFDHQDPAGALPDSVSHSEVLYNYVKPPIHGWAFQRLREALPRPLTTLELELAYERLSRWSEYWLTSRRVEGHRLPYYQHGNDSGWDNATIFDRDRVVEAPDLASLLILQLDVVAGLGRELGRHIAPWEAARAELFTALMEELWTSDGFVAIGALSGQPSPTSSLLTLSPLILGRELPGDVRDALAERVLMHLTDHGLATERPTSPEYDQDGYWRGPIWAPSTALVEDGLRRAGFTELADLVSRRFRALCEHSGFAENFDALTGQGLRDRAYTWTAAVYLTLSAAHVRRSDDRGTR
jgi:hypothetical protein